MEKAHGDGDSFRYQSAIDTARTGNDEDFLNSMSGLSNGIKKALATTRAKSVKIREKSMGNQ